MNNLSESVLHRLVENLMVDVYYPFSVCVWFDCEGKLLKLWQFDTVFCMREIQAPVHAWACWLISNHPNGDMRPYEEDLRNRDRIAAQCGEIQLRMYIVSEDEGVREICE